MKKGIGGMPATTIKSLGGSAWGGKVKKRVFFAKSFTLAELMLAMVFLTVIFATLIGSFIACILLNGANRNLTIATTHAQYIMEEIKNTASTTSGFNSLKQAGVSQWDWSTESNFTGRDLSRLSNENTGVTITDAFSGAAPTSSSELLNVIVAVSWLDMARSKNMALQTLIVEP